MIRLGLYCGIGAVLGLLASRAFGLYPFASAFIGGIASVVLFDFVGAYTVVRYVIGCSWMPDRATLWEMACEGFEETRKVFGAVMYILTMLFIYGMSTYTAYGLYEAVSMETDPDLLFLVGMCIPISLLIIGLVIELCWSIASEKKDGGLPLLRRLPYGLSINHSGAFDVMNDKKWDKASPYQRLLVFTAIPRVYMQALLVGWILVLDLALSLLMVCCKTWHAAIFMGGFLGAVAGELAYMLGTVPHADHWMVFLVGFSAGFFSGPLMYQALRLLARPARTTTDIAVIS